MSRRYSLLLDVDGVVADLIGGYRKWMNHQFGFDFDPTEVLYHNHMGDSPGLADLNEEMKRWFPGDKDGDNVGFGGAFTCFMRDPNVYMRWVDPVLGAVDSVSELRQHYDIVFVTAMMKGARDHYRSKMEWIERWFPELPIMTSPSGEKWRVGDPGDFAVDDRYDTCRSWRRKGISAFVFKQPWSEIPETDPGAGHDWKSILERLTRSI